MVGLNCKGLGLEGMFPPCLRFKLLGTNKFSGSHPIGEKSMIYFTRVVWAHYMGLGFNRVKDNMLRLHSPQDSSL